MSVFRKFFKEVTRRSALSSQVVSEGTSASSPTSGQMALEEELESRAQIWREEDAAVPLACPSEDVVQLDPSVHFVPPPPGLALPKASDAQAKKLEAMLYTRQYARLTQEYGTLTARKGLEHKIFDFMALAPLQELEEPTDETNEIIDETDFAALIPGLGLPPFDEEGKGEEGAAVARHESNAKIEII